MQISFDLPFLEQLEFFRGKGYALSPESWRDVWEKAHARAFTVARVSAMDVLVDIRKALDQAMESGQTLKDFKAGLRDTLESKGWLAPEGEAAKVVMPDGTVRKRLTGWRLNTIFSTNQASAYSVGRYKQLREVKELRPYWQYMTAGDVAVRPSHDAQHGKVRHADHPFWDSWYPLNGFDCRCYVKSLSERQMKQRGLEETKTGTDFKPDEGWNYNVGEAGLDAWEPDLEGFPEEARGLLRKDLRI